MNFPDYSSLSINPFCLFENKEKDQIGTCQIKDLVGIALGTTAFLSAACIIGKRLITFKASEPSVNAAIVKQLPNVIDLGSGARPEQTSSESNKLKVRKDKNLHHLGDFSALKPISEDETSESSLDEAIPVSESESQRVEKKQQSLFANSASAPNLTQEVPLYQSMSASVSYPNLRSQITEKANVYIGARCDSPFRKGSFYSRNIEIIEDFFKNYQTLDLIVNLNGDFELTKLTQLQLMGVSSRDCGGEVRIKLNLMMETIFDYLKNEFNQHWEKKNNEQLERDVKSLSENYKKMVDLLKTYQNLIKIYQKSKGTTEDVKKLIASYEDQKKRLDLNLGYFKSLVERLIQSKPELFQNFSTPEQVSKKQDPSKSPISSFEDYCQIFSSLPQKSIEEKIRRGTRLFNDIQLGRAQISSEHNLAEVQLCDLTWLFMSMAIKKGQGFREGSFIIEDPEGKLFNFLKPSAHEQWSSHVKERTNSPHYHVDVLREVMPATKRTILFMPIRAYGGSKENTLLFFKPENFGLETWQDTFMHLYEFAVATKVKLEGTGGDDLPDMAKERIPVTVAKAFKNILQHMIAHPKHYPLSERFRLETINREAKIWGIALMYDFINSEIEPKFSADQNLMKLVETVKALITEMKLDNEFKRMGREVYLSTNDLKTLMS